MTLSDYDRHLIAVALTVYADELDHAITKYSEDRELHAQRLSHVRGLIQKINDGIKMENPAGGRG